MKIHKKFFTIGEHDVVGMLMAVLFLFAICCNASTPANNHFALLAASFLNGHTYFLPIFYHTLQAQQHFHDTVLWNGNYYWPLGPFPALVIAPLLLLPWPIADLANIQGLVNAICVLTSFYLVYRVAKKEGFSEYDSAWWSIAFCFGSMFLGVALLPSGWYLAQTITVTLLWAAFCEYKNKNRPLIIGLLFGCIAATRITAALGIIFFMIDAWFFTSRDQRAKARRIMQLCEPLILSVAALLLYNYARFDSFLEQGYTNQILIESLVTARNYGLFSIRHLAGNLYYAFLAVPKPVFQDSLSHVLKFPFITVDFWGMSIFVTSPYLLGIFWLKLKAKQSWLLLGTALVVALPLFLYYGIGFIQFGYRYALDFMPFIFVLFMRNYHLEHRHLTTRMKIVIGLCVMFNLYLFLLSFATFPR